MGNESCQTTSIHHVWILLHKVDFMKLTRVFKTNAILYHRKTLLLFNWLSPLTAIMAQQSVPFSAEQSTEATKKTTRPFLHTVLYAPPPVLLELVHAAADDVYTFSLLGLIGKRTGERAARFSDWCWLLATLVGLVENGVERQINVGLQHDGMPTSLKVSLCATDLHIIVKWNRVYTRNLCRVQRPSQNPRRRRLTTRSFPDCRSRITGCR